VSPIGEALTERSTGTRPAILQRLRLSQVLSSPTRLLIFLDEPTNGPPPWRDEVLHSLATLATTPGKSVRASARICCPTSNTWCRHVVVLREVRLRDRGDVKEIRRMEARPFRLRTTANRGFESCASFCLIVLKGYEDGVLVVHTCRRRIGAARGFRAAARAGCVVRELSSFDSPSDGAPSSVAMENQTLMPRLRAGLNNNPQVRGERSENSRAIIIGLQNVLPADALVGVGADARRPNWHLRSLRRDLERRAHVRHDGLAASLSLGCLAVFAFTEPTFVRFFYHIPFHSLPRFLVLFPVALSDSSCPDLPVLSSFSVLSSLPSISFSSVLSSVTLLPFFLLSPFSTSRPVTPSLPRRPIITPPALSSWPLTNRSGVSRALWPRALRSFLASSFTWRTVGRALSILASSSFYMALLDLSRLVAFSRLSVDSAPVPRGPSSEIVLHLAPRAIGSNPRRHLDKAGTFIQPSRARLSRVSFS